VHVDEDLAEPAIRMLAGLEIDLVAADAGLLGVALSSSGKTFPYDETREARGGGFVRGNGVRLARLFDRSIVVSVSDPMLAVSTQKLLRRAPSARRAAAFSCERCGRRARSPELLTSASPQDEQTVLSDREGLTPPRSAAPSADAREVQREVLVRPTIETSIEEIEPAARTEEHEGARRPVLVIGSCFMTAISVD